MNFGKSNKSKDFVKVDVNIYVRNFKHNLNIIAYKMERDKVLFYEILINIIYKIKYILKYICILSKRFIRES